MAVTEAPLFLKPKKIGFVADIIKEEILFAASGRGHDLESVFNHIKIDRFLGSLSEKDALRLKNYATILLGDGKKITG